MTASVSTPHSLPPLLELHDADRLVGWIDGDVVRFRGFGSERSAAHAAAVAHEAMRRRLARGRRVTASETEADLGTIRRATDRANATANGRSVASVLRSFVDRIDGGTGDFAFAVRVPAPIDELRMRGMAYVMYRALRSSGTAWPLLQPVTAPEALTATATGRATAQNESTSANPSGGFHVIERLLGQAAPAWALPWARTTRYVPRARFSASDRPIPPDFDAAAFIRARRANRGAVATRSAPGARLARRLAAFVARLAGVRRSATVALTLMLATGVGDAAGDDATAGALS